MRCLPKHIETPKIRREKPWTCPNPKCNEPIRTVFDGETVEFQYLGAVFALCGGTYETVLVRCPKCNEYIEFTKDELKR